MRLIPLPNIYSSFVSESGPYDIETLRKSRSSIAISPIKIKYKFINKKKKTENKLKTIFSKNYYFLN